MKATLQFCGYDGAGDAALDTRLDRWMDGWDGLVVVEQIYYQNP